MAKADDGGPKVYPSASGRVDAVIEKSREDGLSPEEFENVRVTKYDGWRFRKLNEQLLLKFTKHVPNLPITSLRVTHLEPCLEGTMDTTAYAGEFESNRFTECPHVAVPR